MHPPPGSEIGASDDGVALSVSMSMSTVARKVKFVASDPSRGGLPVKRKQVQQACSACRRKKRRCVHAEASDSAVSADMSAIEDLPARDSSPSRSSPATFSQPAAATPQARPASSHSPDGRNEDSNSLTSRFVGDLNPEGMFLEATASRQSQKGDVGIWLSSAAVASSGQQSQFITSRPPAIMDRFLLPFVREHCLSCLPPEAEFAKLKSTFLQKIHPIFPVVPVSALDGALDNPSNVVLRQLVCLAAGTDPDMASSLYLQNRGRALLSSQDFSQSLSSAVRAILETSIITDRVLHIRALAMLSLYTQPTCPEEADLPAQLGGRAIHHIQTLGLHLLRYDAPNCDDLNNLFCAVWALDIINAAVYGRPCLIHERDIGTNLDDCIRKLPPCFRLFLSIVRWLDQVIELYRPGPSAEVSGQEKVAYMDLPVLEQMIVNADALKVASPLIATLETFYHAVIILSCRLPRPGTSPAASTLPPPSANARRSLAAERIACAIPRDHLSPLPLIPYAVSLALSVEYRKMRHSRLPMFRARSMNAFKRNCELLRKFGNHFWSAKVVAGLGERVLKEMERAATLLNREASTRETSPILADEESKAEPTGQASPRQPVGAVVNPTEMNSALGLDNVVDFSLIDAISGQDVFGCIDPNFNLSAVEDALEANLDIGLPLNWGDWGQFATS